MWILSPTGFFLIKINGAFWAVDIKQGVRTDILLRFCHIFSLFFGLAYIEIYIYVQIYAETVAFVLCNRFLGSLAQGLLPSLFQEFQVFFQRAYIYDIFA